jgi:adenine-specific DNA-methyltransferase
MTPSRDKFVTLLRDDILQLDLAELDFGIYRILNYRRKEIDSFLEGELPQQIDAALAALPGTPTEDERGRIFHHLYTFFARYYDDGDFVTRPRRGRKAAYSVPYNGQDVHFWWATKGSHYVKSGERFQSYVWQDGSRRIRIEVAQADVEKDNVKGAKRYYIPDSIETADGELRVKLAFRPLDKNEVKRFETRRSADDEDDDGSVTVEGRNAQERILNTWMDGAGPRKVKIPAGVDKPLLKKHLMRYVAGQTRDFFVYPQLGEFLDGELDYYLKNEFLEMWDRADGEALARERGKLTVVRDVGKAIVAFLAAIEDVQAQLFEKRKCVLASDWLVRVSALPKDKAAHTLVNEACTNAAQVNEWLVWLGEQPLKGRAVANPAKRGKDILAEYPHLCLHTRHFDESFKYRLLALFDDIEAATGGTLIHSENYAALRTLEYAFGRRAKCIYIDPPYNTPASRIAYKNDFEQASWLALMHERVVAGQRLIEPESPQVIAIDDFELVNLCAQIDSTLQENQERNIVVVNHHPQGAGGNNVSRTHEYAVLISGKERAFHGKLKSETGEQRPFMRSGTGQNNFRRWREKSFYALLVKRSTREVIGVENPPSLGSKYPTGDASTGIARVYPLGADGAERVWRNSYLTGRRLAQEGKLSASENLTIYSTVENDGKRGAIASNWVDKRFNAGTQGTNLLADLFGDASMFTYPKSVWTVYDFVDSMMWPDDGATVLDYFAGSGTTGHAVININRDDGGTRRFVLVEQGEYFDTVLLPRIAKVIACPEWKNGQPKAGVAMAGDDEHWSTRSPALVQVLRLERYEDSLDALELPSEAAARRAGQMSFASDSLLRYVHEAAAGKPSVTLNHAGLARPFEYRIPQSQNGAPALACVDLAVTALLLLGLHLVRVREVARKHKTAKRYLFVEARPNGKPKELHLLFLRDCDDALTGESLRRHAEGEMQWLHDTIAREFGRSPGDYATIWYNRDAVLSSTNGRSLDPDVVRRMLERAPLERTQ